jgi:hypothetical protein
MFVPQNNQHRTGKAERRFVLVAAMLLCGAGDSPAESQPGSTELKKYVIVFTERFYEGVIAKCPSAAETSY